MANKLDTSWFDLGKYDAVETFGIDDWFLQLNRRRGLYRTVMNDPGFKKLSEKRFGEHKIRRSREFIQSIKDNPVLIGDLDLIDEVQKKRDLLIRNADYSDFFYACEGNKNLENVFTLLREERSAKVRKMRILAEPVLAEPDYAVIVADLDASDEQIENDFSKWLKNYRKITKYEIRGKMFKSTDFKKWASYKLLPYIDLTMIAEAEGKRLTQKKLGDLLFPEEFDVDLTERVRNTIKSKAESLLDEKTIRALKNQASAGASTL